ncbi:MAG: xanthine dehydrogenase family protein subunit M [Chloroflexi bacterium]|nr:MAG: xanthine dehydrogenase family protein subunit M [Chloroflexota bacterium]TMF55318.1 MAG: xanthine dehydrogenase family protein subunit M [Chloroflexota bacterium]
MEEALADPEAIFLAGGTDLMVGVNFGRERPEHVVSIRGLSELGDTSVGERVRIGGGVDYTRVLDALGEHSPALVQAARTIGSPQIRNAGTIGGNLGTCSPAGDTLPVLAALDAEVILRSPAGERRVPFSEFMLGPRKSARRPGELVEAVEWLDAGPSQAFLKAGTRNAMVIAVANLALVVDRARKAVRVALGSVGPTIIRALEAEDLARGLFEESGWERPLRPSQAAAARFGELAAGAARPIDDQRGSAIYRRHVVAVMARRALARTGEVA